MKKITSFLFAFAFVIGLSQCKKKVETISSAPASVYITLDVDGGDRVIVDPHGHPDYATVIFEAGDVIYVGNNGQYCGYLTYDGTMFGGDITPTSADDEDYLHFYFMGNKGPVGSAPSSVDISDQTVKYPVISYGRSTQLYNSTNTNYSTTLYNKCAIMRFNITGADTDQAIAITGMNNTVTVDFSANSIGPAVNPYKYSKTGDGDIALHAESNTERWAILLPQDEVTDATAYTIGYSATSTFTVPAVNANGYYDSGVTVTLAAYDTHDVFTINKWCKPVRLSPGNLQATYDGTSWSWDFAPNQWSYIGIAPGNTIVTNSAPWISGTGTVDLFGWSTTATYFGINSSRSETDYSGDFVDWGTLDIGSDAANTWRTLTIEELQYLFNQQPYENATRVDKYASATVNGVYGMVLLPDIWVLPAGCTFNCGMHGWNGNEYDATTWALMEANGAVFLPVAGIRNGSGVYDLGNVPGRHYAYYWSSTFLDTTKARRLYFEEYQMGLNGNALFNRGQSVRLVRYVFGEF